MALTFDLQTFASHQRFTGGAGLLENIGTSFGVPTCILDLGKRALGIIAGPALETMTDKVAEAKEDAEGHITKAKNEILLKLGLMTYENKDGKETYTMKPGFWNRLDSKRNLDTIGDLVADIDGYFQALGDIYARGKAIYDDVVEIKECIGAFDKMLRHGQGPAIVHADSVILPAKSASKLKQAKFRKEIAKIDELRVFVNKCEKFESIVNEIILEREIDPSLFPTVAAVIEGEKGPVFRLVYGPPESVVGRFILSVDGLYYDSQSSGLSLALEEIKDQSKSVIPEDRWRFEFDPNLGGKGVSINSKDLNEYGNTIFDADVIDNSPMLLDYYDKDNFLSVLMEQRDKKISDVEQQIKEFIKTKAGIAIVDNARQALLSETTLMDNKVNRRKKQIEIAVKAPVLYGKGPIFGKGDIPINNFSYLKDLHIAVAFSKQKRLILDQDAVSGVVLPLEPEFVVAPDNREFTNFPNLLVPNVGLGEVVYDTSNVSGTDGVPYSVTDSVIKDGLEALYNFLDSEVVDPSSTEFSINNSAKPYAYNNCQIVSKDASTVFTNGLGVPFFEGITKNQPSSLVSTQASAVGGYARLSDSLFFRDFMYEKSGFTIDFWTHVPALMDPGHGWTDNGVSSQHRLVLACDNVGIKKGIDPQSDILRLGLDEGDAVVRGFVMGFTRDKRMVSDVDPSNEYTVSTVSDVGFYVATTQSRDASSAGFISSSVSDQCVSGAGWHKWSMAASSPGPNGVRFMDAAREYMNICLAVDPENDEVKVYLDSNLMRTESINGVFGTPSRRPPKLPSVYKENSFEYSAVNVGSSAGVDLSAGPLLNFTSQFTPWIIGGGYTDGFASGAASGNFMGGKYGGVRSGLRGHLGSMKFYRKPLIKSEVLQNFKAQKSFFKNVRTVNNLKGRLFFLLGGENAKGQTLLSDIPSASGSLATQKFDNVFIWNARTHPERIWENLEAGYNSVGYDESWGTQTTFGPELSLASSLSIAYPNENIYIAKMAPSGSPLDPSAAGSYSGILRPDWSVTSTQPAASGNLFNMILSSTGDSGYNKLQGLAMSSEGEPFLKARGNDLFQVCGIFYVNGETDAAFHSTAAEYQTHIRDFATKLRSDLAALSWVDATSIPFIQTVIHDDTAGVAAATVRAAQLAAIGDTTMLSNLDLSSFTLQSNNRDLDASSMIKLGDALATTYLNTL